MSTIVCQNIVSCFESHMETTATLKLKVAQQPPPAAVEFLRKDHPPPPEVKNTNLDNFGNWGFLQTTAPKTGYKTETNPYTHPLAKKSSFSRLSPKSLELCTENLGSETGTDIVSDSSSIFSSSSSSAASPPLSPIAGNSTSTYKKDYNSDKEPNFTKNPYQKDSDSSRRTKSFPPPLTTMSGSSSLQVRRHREGGRLIIEAVEAPFRNSYLQAERSDGRLRLCFLTPAAQGGEQEHDDGGVEEAGVDECGEENREMGAEEEEQIDEAVTEEIEAEEEEFDREINLEMEMEKFQRFRRCKEGGHENRAFCNNWRKPAVWVATS